MCIGAANQLALNARIVLIEPDWDLLLGTTVESAAPATAG